MERDIAIIAKNLGKCYRIGQREQYKTLRDAITSAALAPFSRIKDKLSSGNENRDRSFIWALKDVYFEAEKGEVVGIIGGNGSGKSTLLKIMSRITPPTEGIVEIRGRVGSLLEVGTGFHPELTGLENIYLSGAILGMRKKEIDNKFEEIVKFSEIEKFLDTPVKRYSSGMYVRLAFAVAAHLEPDVLLVDEVLAVGDIAFQKKCLGKIANVAKEGRTVLFVSHNMSAIRTMCTRTILLEHGNIVANGDTSDVINRYMSNKNKDILLREWIDEKSAPRTKSVILQSVSICDDRGNISKYIYCDMPFNIEIRFKVKQDWAFVGFAVILYDTDNNCVFSSISNHEKNWYGKAMPLGLYKSVCKIPANFLNNGHFSLNINTFDRGFSDSWLATDILEINILDGPTVRGDFYGAYAGVVRPLLDWETNISSQ